jgi:hypothetical protein
MAHHNRKRAGHSSLRALLGVSAVALALALSACGKPAAQSAKSTEHPVLIVTAHFAPAVAPHNLVGRGFRAISASALPARSPSGLSIEARW